MKPLHKFKLKNLKKLHARTWCIESGFRGTIILPGLRTLARSSSHCCAWSPDTKRDPFRDEEFKFNTCSTWVVKALKKQTKNQDSKQRGHSYGWNVNCLPIRSDEEGLHHIQSEWSWCLQLESWKTILLVNPSIFPTSTINLEQPKLLFYRSDSS